MNTYLYLLPFKNSEHFKVGISSNNFSRIFHLNNIYGFDLEKAIIIKSDNTRFVKVLEKEILSLFYQTIVEFEGLEGHTEICNKRHWSQVVDLITTKKKFLNIP